MSRSRWPGLARYDLAALRPPDAAGRPAPTEQAAFDALRRWCLAAPQQRLAVATLDDTDPAAASRLAAQVALERDGSWQLEACGGLAARLQLRVLTQLRDVTGWGVRRDSHPWDSGTLRDTPAGLQALTRFEPRRATLIVAERTAPSTLQAALHSLVQRSGGFHHPVRVLVLAAAPAAWPAGLAIESFRLNGQAR
jgi:hypothetical protein